MPGYRTLKNQIPFGIALLMIFYAIANAGRAFCGSLSCEALQNPVLWWAGALYGAILLVLHRLRPALLGWAALVGFLVEAFLVFTQVALNMYCSACLGYTGLFVIWLMFVFPEIGRRLKAAVVAATVSLVLAILPIAKAACLCTKSPFGTVDTSTQNIQLLFEPTCRHCHDLLDTLESLSIRDRVRLCPQAWSLASVWKLADGYCNARGWGEQFRCVLSTLSVVRANNAFCMERGLRHVPLIVHGERVIDAPEAAAYLASYFEVGRAGRPGRAGSCSVIQSCN